MPRKSSSRLPTPAAAAPQPYFLPTEAPWGGFINIRLGEEQKAEFYLWLEANVAHYFALFTDMLGAGLKSTVSYDHAHGAFILALTGALMGSDPSSRFCSSSRAASLDEVIALTVWKHYELARGDYGNYRPKDGTFMHWG